MVQPGISFFLKTIRELAMLDCILLFLHGLMALTS